MKSRTLRLQNIQPLALFLTSAVICFVVAWLLFSHFKHVIYATRTTETWESTSTVAQNDTLPPRTQLGDDTTAGCACPACCAVQ